jgi:spermidine synthase
LARTALTILIFTSTLFCSAALLFLVEPMVGKMMLPLLGGTPAVWNTCVVFFQAILLAGYGYAHASTAWLGTRRQAAMHLALLIAPLLLFLAHGPLAVDRGLIAGREGNPVAALLLLLTLSVGLPLFVVCASAPLLQRWFADSGHPAARDPYFLYAASNLGSMLALVGYPALVEPHLSLARQRLGWAVGYVVLAVLTLACAWLVWRHRPPSAARDLTPAPSPEADAGPRAPEPPLAWRRRLRWVLLALVPSSLMLGVTTYITTDIAPIPLLWVVPLALYLLSFIIVFARLSPRAESALLWAGVVAVLVAVGVGVAPRVFRSNTVALWLTRAAIVVLLLMSVQLLRLRLPGLIRRVTLLVLPLLALLLAVLTLADVHTHVVISGGLHLALLFAVAVVCHGELARDRPAAGRLTEYFLWMSVGGVAGGLFNALVAPLAFSSLVEYPLAITLACLMLPPASPAEDRPKEQRRERRLDLVLPLAVAALVLALFWGLWAISLHDQLRALAVRLGLRPAHVHTVMAYALPLGFCGALALRRVRLALGLSTILLGLGVASSQPSEVLAFGLPAGLCYAFVRRPLRFGLGVAALLLAGSLSYRLAYPSLYQGRSFFGVLRVVEGRTEEGATTYTHHRLAHGTTMHGLQILTPDLRRTPMAYFDRSGPIGQVFRAFNTDPSRKVGVIGLGAGTMACYGLPGQQVTFYEIDPVVRAIAFDTDRYFTYIADARERGVRVDLVMGDGRLALDRHEFRTEEDRYGILVVDAFSSDAIPVHLVTRQALALYLQRVRIDGLICFQVTNRYVDLKPVLARLAEDAGLAGVSMSDTDTAPLAKSSTNWVVLARQASQLDRLLAMNQERAAWKAAQEQLLPLLAWPDHGRGLASQAALVCAVLEEQMKGRDNEWVRLKTRQELRDEIEALKAAAEEHGAPVDSAKRAAAERALKVDVWTDDYSNLLGLLIR